MSLLRRLLCWAERHDYVIKTDGDRVLWQCRYCGKRVGR